MKVFMFSLLLLMTFDSCANSFVAKGEVDEITVAPDSTIIVGLNHKPHKDDCQGRRFHLKVSEPTQVANYLAVLNSAMVNKFKVELHNSEGAACNAGKVYFDIIKLSTF